MHLLPDEKLICPGWIRGRSVSEAGNQAHTHLARREEDEPGEYGYVVKKLRRQNDPARRARFYIETLSLEVLKHPRTPKLVFTNAKAYEGKEDLFLITEFIDGKDATSLKTDFQGAVRLTIGLLKVLQHCHSLEVYHRDIKPCHVIVNNDSLDEPYLIDFGLAYTPNEAAGAATQDGEGRGNRFIMGPENLPTSALDNRGPSVDIMQSIGVLFYLLYGVPPSSIRDSQGKKPHERHRLSPSDQIPDWKQKRLSYVFDKAFTWEPQGRFETCDACITVLQQLLAGSLSPEDEFQIQAEEIISKSGIQEEVTKNQRFSKLQEEIKQIIDRIVRLVNDVGKSNFNVQVRGAPERQLVFTPAHLNGPAFVVLLRTTKTEGKYKINFVPFNGDPPSFNRRREIAIAQGDLTETIDILSIEESMRKTILGLVSDAVSKKQ